MKSALLIGCGKMGGALLRQWVRSDTVKFTVADPAAQDIPSGAAHVKKAADLGDAVFDYLIVAIKPQLVDTILSGYAKHMTPDSVIVSIAAGCSAARLQNALGQRPVIRIMPNLPSMIGAGVAGLYASDDTLTADRDAVYNLMALAGTNIWVDDEDGIDRITAVAGSGPGYVFEIARTYVKAACDIGFTVDEARDLVLGTILGTVNMAMQSDDDLETLRNNVTSKNGTTQAGLEALNGDDALTQRLRETIEAAYKRAVELR